MSKGSENAKRRNVNQDNLLQMEMGRFEKQHNKEMKSILLERQMAKEAMSDIRRHRASSLLAARMGLHQSNTITDSVNSFSTSPAKSFSKNKQNRISSELQTSDAKEETSPAKSPMQEALTKTSETFTLLRRTCTENLNNILLPSRNDNFGRCRMRSQTISEGTGNTRSDFEDGSSYAAMLQPITFYRKNGWVNPAAVKDATTALQERDREELVHSGDSRPRRRSDASLLFKRRPTPLGLGKSTLTASSQGNSPLPLSRPLRKRTLSMDSNRLPLLARGTLELPCVNTSLQRSNLSPSRGLAKFRQPGSAAAAAHTLVSRYQRDKAIARATENLIAEREIREKIRQEQHQQLREDLQSDKACRLRERFFTIAQLITALNKLRVTAATGRESSFSQ